MKRDYTVIVAGSERHDGECPYAFVLSAGSLEAAIAEIRVHMAAELGQHDLEFRSVSLGSPGKGCGFAWNDLRKPAEPPRPAPADDHRSCWATLVDYSDEWIDNYRDYELARANPHFPSLIPGWAIYEREADAKRREDQILDHATKVVRTTVAEAWALRA